MAPAAESDPAKRALLVLKWFLSSLKQQQYGGRNEKDGVKKPLNAFLGELFLANWKDETGTTELISEQVSHHPPVTACYLWNDETGIRAEGYTRQDIRFSGSVNIQQIGHAILHIDRHDEDYLIPLPNVKVKGLISGTPHPELHGTYHISSSTGYISEIDFSGKGFLSGKKHSLDAILYEMNDKMNPLYTVTGQWNDQITIRDKNNEDIETIDINTLQPTPMDVEDLSNQDPWESRKAWAHVIAALHRGDMQATVNEKSKVEKAQRELRKLEETKGLKWKPLFFRNTDEDPVFQKLAGPVGVSLESDKTVGVWKLDLEAAKNIKKPFHGSLGPAGGRV